MTVGVAWRELPYSREVLRRSATDPTGGVVTMYPHGFALRLYLLLDDAEARHHLKRCGWSADPDPRQWKHNSPKGFQDRWVMKGTAWLTHAAPRNTRLPLAVANKAWRTRLYGLSVDLDKDGTWHLDLEGVRIWDVERFVVEVLGLTMDDVELEHFRRLERYIVLTPEDAHKVAATTASEPSQGGGRLARKGFLVPGHPVPVIIRRRTRSEVKVYVYRIDRGATCLYKCEAVLTGKRRNRSVFGTDDIEVIDGVLRDLVDDCDLRPLHKPVRWEPRTFNTDLELGGFDEALRKLPQKAWRGGQLGKSWVTEAEECHNPDSVVLVDVAPSAVTIPPESGIRTHLEVHPPSPRDEEGPSSLLPELDDLVDGDTEEHPLVAAYQPTRWTRSTPTYSSPRRSFALEPRGAWMSLAQEFQRLPSGVLIEVVLDGNCDPANAIDALVADPNRSVGVSHLCHRVEGSNPPSVRDIDAWASVLDAMAEHPVTEDIDTWVVVIDTSTVMAVHEWVQWQVEFYGSLGDNIPRVCRSVAAWLWNWLGAYREACEVSGLTMVLVTTDTRPDHGRGKLLRNHFFRDGRVRSWLGDAGRYHTHQRYLVMPEAEGVVALKDEVEGLPGRRLYQSPTVSL